MEKFTIFDYLINTIFGSLMIYDKYAQLIPFI